MNRKQKRNKLQPREEMRIMWHAMSRLALANGDTVIAKNLLKWERYVKRNPITDGLKQAHAEMKNYFNILTKEVDSFLMDNQNAHE